MNSPSGELLLYWQRVLMVWEDSTQAASALSRHNNGDSASNRTIKVMMMNSDGMAVWRWTMYLILVIGCDLNDLSQVMRSYVLN